MRRIQRAGEVYVSAASGWKMAIKAALGKLVMTSPLAPAVADYGFTPLAVSLEHADAVRSLPQHHRDPFDRMLIAQARVEGLAIVSRDRALSAYQVQVQVGV